MSASILVAGIGNIFFGDDAFGCAVANALARRPLPDNVRVVDYGIRGYDLAYALMDDHAAVILVDAVPRGGTPGSVYLIEPDLDTPGEGGEIANGHSLDPATVLQMVRSLGGRLRKLYLVGCEPALLETGDGAMGLSEKVEAAIPAAIEIIEKLIRDLPSEPPTPASLAQAPER